MNEVVVGPGCDRGELGVMNDSINAALERMRLALAKQFDDAINAAITKFLGNSDWTPRDLVGRLHRAVIIKRGSRPMEQYWLDDRILLIAHPVEYGVEGSKLIATRKFEAAVALALRSG